MSEERSGGDMQEWRMAEGGPDVSRRGRQARRGQKAPSKPGDLREHSWASPVEVRVLTPEELEQRKQERDRQRAKRA